MMEFKTTAGESVFGERPSLKLRKHFADSFKLSPDSQNNVSCGLGVLYKDMEPQDYHNLRACLQAQGLELSEDPSTAMLEYALLNISVEPHTDKGFGSLKFFLWVLGNTPMPAHQSPYPDNRALFLYYDLKGKSRRIRLEEGQIIAFSQTKPHSLYFCGEELRVGMGVARKIDNKKDNNSVVVL